MNCKEIGPLLMGYIDNELGGGEVREVERHLQSCDRCRSELLEFEKLDGITSAMKFIIPEEEIWKGYWLNVYNRIERGIGWILLSVGIGLLVVYGAYYSLKDFFTDPSVSVVLKLSIGIGGIGIVVLVLSIARERLYFHTRQRYKDIRR